VKKILTKKIQGQTQGKDAGKTRTFQEIPVKREGRLQAGGGKFSNMKNRTTRMDFVWNPITHQT